MKYLLDTQVLIYLGAGTVAEISPKALRIYQNQNNSIYVSQISFWEIAIKINMGKLKIPIGLNNIIFLAQNAGIEIIPLQNSHILNYVTLPMKSAHKDPFDRLLIATALYEKMSILSNDSRFDQYSKIKRVWE